MTSNVRCFLAASSWSQGWFQIHSTGLEIVQQKLPAWIMIFHPASQLLSCFIHRWYIESNYAHFTRSCQSLPEVEKCCNEKSVALYYHTLPTSKKAVLRCTWRVGYDIISFVLISSYASIYFPIMICILTLFCGNITKGGNFTFEMAFLAVKSSTCIPLLIYFHQISQSDSSPWPVTKICSRGKFWTKNPENLGFETMKIWAAKPLEFGCVIILDN